jgi:hypothetical protein
VRSRTHAADGWDVAPAYTTPLSVPRLVNSVSVRLKPVHSSLSTTGVPSTGVEPMLQSPAQA